MPRGAYAEVIAGPARRLEQAGGKFAIEPRVTERLLADVEAGGGSDALPLLAFTLEQLYLDYGAGGALRLADYEAFGGLKGAIDAAVQRAFARADAVSAIPKDRDARLRLLRRGLIPWLAGIDPDSKSPRRNIARRSDIPPEAAPLIDLLIEERLLSSDTRAERDPATGEETRAATVEPTHEALLRQWGLLDGWLKEDFGLLAALEAVKRAAGEWDANGRDPAWLAHRGQRLADAGALDARPDIAAKLDAADRAYLAACRTREAVEAAEREQARLNELARAKAETDRAHAEAERARARAFRAQSDCGVRRRSPAAGGRRRLGVEATRRRRRRSSPRRGCDERSFGATEPSGICGHTGHRRLQYAGVLYGPETAQRRRDEDFAGPGDPRSGAQAAGPAHRRRRIRPEAAAQPGRRAD
jgi:hypothetical protein